MNVYLMAQYTLHIKKLSLGVYICGTHISPQHAYSDIIKNE